MTRFFAFLFIFSLVSFPLAAADGYILNQDDNINYFNYTSDRCRDIGDLSEVYRIALSLRDSKNPKDQIDAVDCLLTAAARAHAESEYELARMYSIGSIVPQNAIFAYKWAELAVLDFHPDASILRDKLESELSTDELELAVDGVKKIFEERQSGKKSAQESSQGGNSNNGWRSQSGSVRTVEQF